MTVSAGPRLFAPFSSEQVFHLNLNQVGLGAPLGLFHPFTCPERSDGVHGEDGGDKGLLIATEAGWICPYCGYTQDWAIPFVAAPSVNPCNATQYVAEQIGRIDAVIGQYLALRQSRKLSIHQDAQCNTATQRIWDATAVIIPDLYRKRMELNGIWRAETGLEMDASWLPRSSVTSSEPRIIEVVFQADRIGNPIHPGHAIKAWTDTSSISNVNGVNVFFAELTQGGHVTHWRELPTTD